MAAQALNATRDTFEPIDARGGGNVNVNRFTLPKAREELTVILVLFALLLISMIVNGLNYARNARNDEMLRSAEERATKAETDLKTQVWLRSDSLTKENAEIRAHVMAIQDILQAYGIAKTVPKPKQLLEER